MEAAFPAGGDKRKREKPGQMGRRWIGGSAAARSQSSSEREGVQSRALTKREGVIQHRGEKLDEPMNHRKLEKSRGGVTGMGVPGDGLEKNKTRPWGENQALQDKRSNYRSM